MLKFNLRDLIWLTVVVALVMVIFINMFAFRHKKLELNEKLAESVLQNEQLQARLQVTEQRVQALQNSISQSFQQSKPSTLNQ